MIWYSHLLKNFPQFVVIHIVKGFSTVNEAEVDAFLELSCFFCDPMDVGNLISGSSAFSKSSLNIWKFTVHKLLKPGLENFEHYFTMNKASGGDGIPVELFQILEDDAVKVLHSINIPANLENSAVATGLEKLSFDCNPKERQCQRMFKLLHN